MKALPSADGVTGGSVGVGISFALTILDDKTQSLVGDGASIGVRTDVGPGARIARGARIGDDETVAAGMAVDTDRKGLWLAA